MHTLDTRVDRLPRWRPWVAMVVSLGGLGMATWLTEVHYADPGFVGHSCILGGTGSSIVDCQAVLTSSYSTVFGLPVALYGAVFFAFMAVMNLPAMWRSTSAWIARARLGAAVTGMVAVLYLVGVEALLVKHVCIYCTSVHVLQFVLFLLVVTGWEATGYAAAHQSEPVLAASTLVAGA
jgi:uncharacterized membrane protein